MFEKINYGNRKKYFTFYKPFFLYAWKSQNIFRIVTIKKKKKVRHMCKQVQIKANEIETTF